MKKQLLIVLLIIFMTGCAAPSQITEQKQEMENNIEIEKNDSIYLYSTEDESLVEESQPSEKFSIIHFPDFEYPLGWQILSMTGFESNSNEIVNANDLYKSEVDNIRVTDINFERPHDLGNYGRHVDVQIKEYVFKDPLDDLDQYLSKFDDYYGVHGKVETYKSQTGETYKVWIGENVVYDGFYVIYLTSYIDENNNFHLVEISKKDTDLKLLMDQLKPIVDSLKLNKKV